MVKISPFRALRPGNEFAQRVASVPYDVVSRAEARELAAGNPYAFLHVTKPEIALPDDIDAYDDKVYAQGARVLRQLIREGILVRDEVPHLYIYALTMGNHCQTGVVFGASVAEYDANIIRKHELTRPDKENDRVRHIDVLNAQTGKVFLVHKENARIDACIQQVTTHQSPEIDFVADDGVRHQVWVVADAATTHDLVAGFAACGSIYIADGHHRSAAASRVAERRRALGTQREETEMFLAVSFPARDVRILPYNRVVRDLMGNTPESFLARVAARCVVTEGKPNHSAPNQVHMYLAGRWYGVQFREGTYDVSNAAQRLDVALLQDQILAPLLGIADPRRDVRIDFIGGARGDQALVQRVDHEGWAVAFSMHPTSIDDLFAIADAEQIMPPKSTWFEPKLRDGLLVHTLG